MNKPDAKGLAEIFPDIAHVDLKELQYLADNSEFRHFEQDEYVFKKGQEVESMVLVVSGEFKMFGFKDVESNELGFLRTGDITALLPYSRLKTMPGYAQAMKDSWILEFPKSKMNELIHHYYELTEALVHLMSNRIRRFTTARLQNEKMMALGKLSAGLAHELNNPASAIVRSSKELLTHLQQQPDHFKKMMSIKITPEEVDKISELLFKRINENPDVKVSMMERQSLEDDLLDCLVDYGADDPEEIAENLADFNFSCEELEKVYEVSTQPNFPAIIRWINENLSTERMVRDIEEASTRISELVGSVKNFTHMDRSIDKSKANIHEGLDSTLTLLNHKLKKQNIKIERKYSENLAKPSIRVGEINQVWTNLIDNAIDALDHTDNPVINIETQSDHNYVRTYIRDNGPGIPEDLKTRIFEPFFTTKEIGKGTGLGLEMVMNIITRHNGSIQVNSEPGKTEFEVCLPIE